MIQSFISNAPGRLSGREFEELVLYRARQMNDAGEWHCGRYGVQVSHMKDPVTGKLIVQPLQSLPDFEAACPPEGRQVIFETKVCTSPSYQISTENKRKERQLRHLLDRSAMGCLCYLLIHFNERVLKTRSDEPFTVALPVTPESQLIRDVLTHGTKTLSRSEADLYGLMLPWNVHGERGRKQTPDLSVLFKGRDLP